MSATSQGFTFTAWPGVLVLAAGVLLTISIAAITTLFARASHRPVTNIDRQCERVDRELDARRDGTVPAARARIESDGGVVVSFPARLRLVQGGLEQAGDEAATVDFDWHGPERAA